MSRVDESNDDRRIREMNEAALRRKVDGEKKDQERRVQKAFNEVIQERQHKETAKKERTKEAAQKDPTEKQRLLDRVRKGPPKDSREGARRAALSRAIHGDLQKKGARSQEESARAMDGRATEHSARSKDEIEHVEREARTEDEREHSTREDKQSEIAKDARRDARDGRVDPDGERRREKREHGGSREEKTPGIQGTEGPRQANPVRIPREVLEKIVSAIHAAVKADGRTTMQVSLRGPGLEGVQLEVHAEKGRVRCAFHGANDELRSLLTGSKDALAAGLERRGLTLAGLTFG